MLGPPLCHTDKFRRAHTGPFGVADYCVNRPRKAFSFCQCRPFRGGRTTKARMSVPALVALSKWCTANAKALSVDGKRLGGRIDAQRRERVRPAETPLMRSICEAVQTVVRPRSDRPPIRKCPSAALLAKHTKHSLACTDVQHLSSFPPTRAAQMCNC